VYLCEGNHDLFQSRSAFEDQVRASGVPLLLDEVANLRIRGRDVQLLGMQWDSGPHSYPIYKHHLDVLRPHRDEEAFQILLAHHPHAFDRAAEAGIPLVLSGHTHGGQLMLTPEIGGGPMLFKYWSGLYRQGDSALVVSNGVGNWFPLRIGAPAEILHLTLRCA
jgi:predicted MPP superfamily phosphohydrolase